MRKHFTLIVLFTSLLSACGGGNDSSTPASTPVADVGPGAAGGDFTSGLVAISNATPITEIQPAR